MMASRMLLPAPVDPGGVWIADRACADKPTHTFFIGRGESARAAKAICAGCPVSTECLEYALTNREVWGIWGGTTERDRRLLRRGRAA